MARAFKVTTTTAAVSAQLVAGGAASIFYGVVATGAGNNATYYLKLYWEGTGTAAPTASNPVQTTTTPTAGTTVPQMTIQIPTAGVLPSSTVEPVNNGGRLWYWITTSLADNAAAVLATGGDSVSIIFD